MEGFRAEGFTASTVLQPPPHRLRHPWRTLFLTVGSSGVKNKLGVSVSDQRGGGKVRGGGVGLEGDVESLGFLGEGKDGRRGGEEVEIVWLLAEVERPRRSLDDNEVELPLEGGLLQGGVKRQP
jgi:hypothetical protein